MTDWTQGAIERRIQDRIGELQAAQVRIPETRPTAVVVTDVHMPFGSMIAFMVKWAIASIPALLIVFVVGLIFWTIALALLGVVGLSKH
ncbi:MAG: hypothetical protein ACHP9V_07075 [Terriglobales bacterium]